MFYTSICWWPDFWTINWINSSTLFGVCNSPPSIRSNNIRRKAPWSSIETGQKKIIKGGKHDWNPRRMNVTSIPKYVTSWIYWCSIESRWSRIALFRVHQLTCGVYDDLRCCLKLLMLMYFLYIYSEKYIDCLPSFKSQPVSPSTPNARSPCGYIDSL